VQITKTNTLSGNAIQTLRNVIMDIRKHVNVKGFSAPQFFVVLLLLCCTGLLVRSAPPSQLERVITSGELRVIARNGPTSFYEGPEGLTGFEYSLLQGFAQSLGVKLVINAEVQPNRIYPKAYNQTYDLMSAGMAHALNTTERLRFASPYLVVSQQLIYNVAQTAPVTIEDLLGKHLVVLAKSEQVDQLKELQKTLPELRWAELDATEMIDLLEHVEQNPTDYALVDSSIYTLYRYAYPHTQAAFAINSPQPVAWALSLSRDNSLYYASEKYLNTIRQNGVLAQTTALFFEQIVAMTTAVTTDDAVVFSDRIATRLPLWKDNFKTAAEVHNIEWQLLAAIGYQESHWDAQAESFTGVRGLMMLTFDTAKELGITDREDPQQSIHGGAKYIKNLQERLPTHIQGEDRLYMALAAYNVGLGHLEDARVITQKMGGNPNSWKDVSQYFPLLSKSQYFMATKHGYARGSEPVTFVKNVLNYQKILTWHDKHEQFRMATTQTSSDGQVPAPEAESSGSEKLSRNGASSLSIL
jgi:membrane-bound lytic murein transglycosylase F